MKGDPIDSSDFLCYVKKVKNEKGDIVGLTETLTNVFDAEEFNEHQTFTGTDKSKLKGFRGLAFLIRKSLKYHFTESNLGLWLDVNFNCVDYSIGLYCIPCESSRHWDGNYFDEIQEDVLKFKNPSRNISLMGDFNARTGNLGDCLLLDGEVNNIESRANRDTKINSNGRLLVDLCKTTEIAILNGRIGEDKHIGEFTCVTHIGKSSVDYFLAKHCCFDSILNLSVKNFYPSLSDVHCCLVLELGCSKVSPKIESPQNATQMKRVWIEAKKKEFFGNSSFFRG